SASASISTTNDGLARRRFVTASAAPNAPMVLRHQSATRGVRLPTPRVIEGLPMATIYLLHLDKPLCHAKHYLGLADDLAARLERHADGNGARMLAVGRERGITWQCVRTWEGADRKLERKLKKLKATPRLCPICSPASANKRANFKKAVK